MNLLFTKNTLKYFVVCGPRNGVFKEFKGLIVLLTFCSSQLKMYA